MNDPRVADGSLYQSELLIQSVAARLQGTERADLEQALGLLRVGRNHLNGGSLEEKVAAFFDGPGADEIVLTAGQQRAYNRICRWMNEPDAPYFVVKGKPGSGKTTLARYIKRRVSRAQRWTSPTNKAAKVLSRVIGDRASTTFSALGLRMSHDEEDLVMEYGRDPPHFADGTLFVVDENSMVGRQLDAFVARVQHDFNLKVLFIGDPYQLFPVGERYSNTYNRTRFRRHTATLREVKRHGGPILELSESIRRCIDTETWRSPVVDHWSESGGVRLFPSQNAMLNHLRQLDNPAAFDNTKIIAWRNATVDRYNRYVRNRLGFTEPFHVTERVLLSAPHMVEDEIVAHIDDEFVVEAVEEALVRADSLQVPVWQLQVRNDEQSLVFRVAQDRAVVESILGNKATEARRASGVRRKWIWDQYHAIKNSFNQLRYAYALTSHRAQGSTYESVYVDQHDILANQDKEEAFHSLMVGFTRATTWNHTF